MSKAVLVINEPRNCRECDVCASWQESSSSDRMFWCPPMNNRDVEPEKRPDWCPLHPVLEK